MTDTLTPQQRPWLRWAVMFSMSMVVFGGYYVYDAISPLRGAMEAELGMSPSDFGWLVAFYSWPNILGITIVGGILMDRKSVRFVGLIFTLLCVAGALLMAVGASEFFRHSSLQKSLTDVIPGVSGELFVMITGRVLFGFGAEVLIVAQNKVVARWFRDKELALAFGLNLVVCRLGTFAAFNVSALMVDTTRTFELVPSDTGLWIMASRFPGLSMALWIAAAVMLGSLGAFFIFMALDRSEIKPPGAATEIFRMSDLKDLLTNRTFLAITMLGVFFYGAVFPFTSFATDILQNKFGLSTSLAGALPSTVILATIVGTPLGGLFIDRFGKRATMMVFGSFLLMAVHLTLALTMLTPIVPMIVLGLAFSLVPAAMWPSIPFLVPERQLGTAYGVMGMLQNVGLWGVPILIGQVTEWANPGVTAARVKQGGGTWDYTAALLLLAALGAIAFVLSLKLRFGAGGPGARELELPRTGQSK